MKPKLQNLVLQIPSTSEVQQVRMAAMLADCTAFSCTNTEIDNLAHLEPLLRAGALPVGSVEFVRKAMSLAGIDEPENLSYPKGCEPFLGRKTSIEPVRSLAAPCFVKPTATKAFTGFVFRGRDSAHPAYNEHDRDQLDQLMQLPDHTLIHTSEVVKFQCEWRFYVMKGLIIGSARYDPEGADGAPEPDLATVQTCISELGLDHPFALDMGVLDDGRTVMIECNDAWAIGWYRNSLKPMAYLEFLLARWRGLLNKCDHPSGKNDAHA